MAETTPKYIRLADSMVAVAQQLQVQLGDRYPTEGALYGEAIRRGLLLLALDAHAAGGYQRDELVAILGRELLPALAFLIEHNALPAIVEQAVLGKYRAGVRQGENPVLDTSARADEIHDTTIPIDSAVMDSLLLGGDDDLWDDDL